MRNRLKFASFRRRENAIFHTTVTTSRKKVVDIDQATHLMDEHLWEETLAAMSEATPSEAAQWAWDDYCARHLKRYGKPFKPDVEDKPRTTLLGVQMLPRRRFRSRS